MIDISVVIPTYNRIDTLRYVVPSLLANDIAPKSMEIIVADSNSNDGTAEYLAEVSREHPAVRYRTPRPAPGRILL